MKKNSPSTVSRRRFLKYAAATAAATATLSARSWAQVVGANSDIRVGVIGAGGRGGSHCGAFSNMEGVLTRPPRAPFVVPDKA